MAAQVFARAKQIRDDGSIVEIAVFGAFQTGTSVSAPL